MKAAFFYLLCFLSVALLSKILLPFLNLNSNPLTPHQSMAETMKELHGVKIWTNPPESVLSDLGVFTEWKKYASPPAKIPWTFDSGTEKMYILKGKVNIYCEGHDDEPFQIVAGDLVEFPYGMKIVFEVAEAVEKHFLVIKQ